MKQIAILSIAKSSTLVVLNMDSNLYNVVSVQTLDPSKPLTETSAKLKGLELEELHVVLQGSITSETGNQLISYTFGKGRNKKHSVLYKQDLQKIKTLGSRLNVSVIKIYDIIDIIALMGRYNPIILVGDYLNNRYSYIYVNNGLIEDYRIWREITPEQVQNMKDEYKVDYAESIYNNILDREIKNKVVNWDSLDTEYKDALSLTLGCLLIKPKIVSDLKATALNSSTGFHKPVSPRKIVVNETKETNDENPYINIKEKNLFGNGEKSNKSILEKVLDTVAITLIIATAGCFVANSQLPEDIEYLKNKQTEFSDILTPKASVKSYYDDVVKAGGGSYDKGYLDKIQAIQVNGYLAEVKLQATSVAIVLYIKGGEEDSEAVKAELEKYLESLREIVNVTQIADQGTAVLEDTKLSKYVINATRN